jgi:hypothetical protein
MEINCRFILLNVTEFPPLILMLPPTASCLREFATYKLKSDLYTPPFKGSPLWMGEKTAFTHRLTLKPCKIKTPAPKIRGVALPILRGSNFTTGLRSPGSGSKFPHAFPDFLQWHHVGSLPFTVARPHRNLTGFPWLPASLILQKIACN